MSSSIMFRSSIRCFRAVGQPVTRQFRPLPTFTKFNPTPFLVAKRYYAGSLHKEEVEKRIIEILKGFDKVTAPEKVSCKCCLLHGWKCVSWLTSRLLPSHIL